MGYKDKIARRLNKNSSQPFKIIRAYIADLDINPDTGRKTIYINEYGALPEPPYIKAEVPSFTAVEATGAGIQSAPPKGAGCLAYVPLPGNTQMEKAQIITFLPDLGVATEGSLNAEPVEQGDFYLKIGGRMKSVFKMSKEGVMSLFAGQFGRLEISAIRKNIELSSKRFNQKSAVGIYKNEYIEFDPISSPGVEERTSHTSSFVAKQEKQVDSDQRMDTEEVAIIPLVTPYVNKAVVRGGKIHNSKQPFEDLATHSYVIDTRNSTGSSPMQKDAVTKLELGFQGGHYPGGGTDFRSPGNLIHWTAKRNVPGNVGTFLMRYGKLDGDHGTKVPLAPASSVIPTEYVTGELFRRQVYQGLQLNVPLGVPVIDPLGAGKGYGSGDGDNALESYTESLGTLSSVLLVGQPTYKSIARKHMHATSAPGTGLFIDEQYGGEAMPTDPDFYTRTIEKQLGFVPQQTFTERVGINVAEGFNYKMELSDITMNKTTLAMTPLEMKLESYATVGLDTGTLVTDHSAMTTTVNHSTAGIASFLELASSALSLQTMSGVTKLDADATSMTLSAASGACEIALVGTPPKISIKAGTVELTVDSINGVQVNGVSLATAGVIDWLSQNASFFSLGPMGPNAISPAALPTLVMGSVPNPGVANPTSWKTGS